MAITLSRPILSALVRVTGVSKPFKSEAKAREHVRTYALRPQSYAPPRWLRRDVAIDVDRRDGWPVYRVTPAQAEPSGALVYAHGGGWVNEMSPLHWHLVAALAAEAGTTVIVPIYPLIPFGNAEEVVDGFASIVAETIAHTPRTSIGGDSAGGQIALSAAIELRDRGITLPDTILIAPALDVTFSNPEIDDVQPRDPLLGRPGARHFAELWRGDLALDDPRVSPLHADLAGLGRLLIFAGSDDILTPDVRVLARRAREAGVPFDLYEAAGELHDYPLVPTRAARVARELMIERLRS